MGARGTASMMDGFDPLPTLALIFTQQPAGILGLPLVTLPIVAVVNESGQLDTSFVGNVALTTQGGGSIIGITTIPVVLGLAVFAGLTVTGSGTIKLVASVPGLGTAVSVAI